jgi:hypothetical protein
VLAMAKRDQKAQIMSKGDNDTSRTWICGKRGLHNLACCCSPRSRSLSLVSDRWDHQSQPRQREPAYRSARSWITTECLRLGPLPPRWSQLCEHAAGATAPRWFESARTSRARQRQQITDWHRISYCHVLRFRGSLGDQAGPGQQELGSRVVERMHVDVYGYGKKSAY